MPAVDPESHREGSHRGSPETSQARVLAGLRRLYPEARTELRFHTPFQLLVATMLSAQSTDRQVNRVTEHLFRRYPGPREMAELAPEELAEEIRGVGLYRTKARHVVETARLIVERHGGEVPVSRRELMRLPGVGRKTANVVLANAFRQDTMAVDTHVFRVAHRLGLSSGRTVRETEEDLLRVVPPGMRGDAHHWLIYHGRRVCRARRPRCGECGLRAECPSASAEG